MQYMVQGYVYLNLGIFNSESSNSENNISNITQQSHLVACKNYDKTITKKIQTATKNIFYPKQQQQNQVHNSKTKTKTKTKKRIMVVDDESDINFLFKMVLESEDDRLKVDSFTEPLIALENFKPCIYDLVLIDIVMPNMNGFDFYDKIRKLDKKVKVCFLTAGVMYYESVRKEAFPELDARNCFIQKPIANEDLIRQIKEILELK